MDYLYELRNLNDFRACLETDVHDTRIIYFYKHGCPPCESLSLQLNMAIKNNRKLINDLNTEKLVFVKIDVGNPEFSKLLKDYGVTRTPTVFVAKNGGSVTEIKNPTVENIIRNATM